MAREVSRPRLCFIITGGGDSCVCAGIGSERLAALKFIGQSRTVSCKSGRAMAVERIEGRGGGEGTCWKRMLQY